MAYTAIPTVVDGDDLTEDVFIATKAAVEELQAQVPETSGTFTPTSGNITVGNGSFTGRWVRSGALVYFTVKLTFGSTTAITGSVSITLQNTLPVALLDAAGGGWAEDTGGSPVWHPCGWRMAATTRTCTVGNHNGGAVTGVSPFTWGTGDILVISGSYLAA